jgi:hypothetical protein
MAGGEESMKPNEEQIKKFWEWCGLKEEEATDGETYWFDGDTPLYLICELAWEGYPRINLNNLFRWAVPKLNHDGWVVHLNQTGTERIWQAQIDNPKDFHCVRNEDPALALFWAIYKIIKEGTSRSQIMRRKYLEGK